MIVVRSRIKDENSGAILNGKRILTPLKGVLCIGLPHKGYPNSLILP